MKSLLIVCYLYFSFCANALWAPMESFSQDHQYANRPLCERLTGKDCVNVPADCVGDFCKIEPKMIPDMESPVYSKNQISSCEELEREGCESLLADLECEIEGEEAKMVYEDGQKEIYCSKFLRYNLKDSGEKIVAIDEDLKASYEAQKAQEKALQDALKIAGQRMECGKDVMKIYFVRNAQKTPALTIAQVTQAMTQFSGIKGLLEAGALESARTAIEATEADGTLVTASDKAALVSKINSCL